MTPDTRPLTPGQQAILDAIPPMPLSMQLFGKAGAAAKVLEDRIAALEAELVAARANQKLAAFGAWAAREFRDTLSDVDGGSAQEQMERTGVIVKREVAEPCGEGCVCAGYGAFPHECFVFADDVRAALGATEQKGETK